MTTLHMHHAFWYIPLLSLHAYNMKLPNFTFCEGRECKTMTFFFFSSSSMQSFRIQLQKTLPTLTNWTKWIKCSKVWSSLFIFQVTFSLLYPSFLLKLPVNVCYFGWVFGDVMFCKVPAFRMLICILKEKVKLQVFKTASQNINPFPGWTACSQLCESKDNFFILLVKGGRGLWNHIRMSTILPKRQEKNGKNHEKLTLILFHYPTALSSI